MNAPDQYSRGTASPGQELTAPAIKTTPEDRRGGLNIARGILADIKDHPDPTLRAACETVMESSQEHSERSRAEQLLKTLKPASPAE